MDSLLSEPPGKPQNTRVGSLSLLQRIFPTKELNWGLPHCRQTLYQLSYPGSLVYWLRVDSNAMTGVLIRRGHAEMLTHAQRLRREWCGPKLRNDWSWKARRNLESSSHQRQSGPLTPWVWTSWVWRSRTMTESIPVVLSHPVGGNSSWKPQKTNAACKTDYWLITILILTSNSHCHLAHDIKPTFYLQTRWNFHKRHGSNLSPHLSPEKTMREREKERNGNHLNIHR